MSIPSSFSLAKTIFVKIGYLTKPAPEFSTHQTVIEKVKINYTLAGTGQPLVLTHGNEALLSTIVHRHALRHGEASRRRVGSADDTRLLPHTSKVKLYQKGLIDTLIDILSC